jgi:D-alanyl-D-alanine carboxypeptidase
MRAHFAPTLVLALAPMASVEARQAVLSATPPAVQGVDTRITARVRGILGGIVERGAPGVSIAFILPDGTEVTATAGYADIEAKRPMQPSDRLLSGSIGKTYVAAAALRLVALGALDLDRRAAQFFAGEAWFQRLPNANDFTVRQLLRHQSGLERYEFQPAFWEALVADPEKVWRPEEQLAYIADRAPLFAAGEGWAYSDSNYLIVGLILERLSGQRFHAHVREHLLAPAGLVDTVPSDTRRIPGLTQGYCRALAQLGVPERVLVDGEFVIHPGFEWCGGGYASTPRDLARWTRRLCSGAAFEGEYLPAMLDTVPADATLGRRARYGLGVIVRETPLGEARGHDGIMTGFLAATAWFPTHGIAVAVQLNTDDGRVIGKPMSALLVELVSVALEELRAARR